LGLPAASSISKTPVSSTYARAQSFDIGPKGSARSSLAALPLAAKNTSRITTPITWPSFCAQPTPRKDIYENNANDMGIHLSFSELQLHHQHDRAAS
jgi:hypothetical protein